MTLSLETKDLCYYAIGESIIKKTYICDAVGILMLDYLVMKCKRHKLLVFHTNLRFRVSLKQKFSNL